MYTLFTELEWGDRGMHVGRRVAKLRAAHGESLREAAARTGVSHTTIARIEKGEVTGSFHSTLRKIADGYDVRMEFLLTGRDPRQDFELAIRRLPPDDRSRLYFVSARARVKMVLDFFGGRVS
jgi:transcriptional regulator with XRE-family HTH domain